MSDIDLVKRLCVEIADRHCTREVVASAPTRWPRELWDEIERAGLTRIGGAGEAVGAWPDAAAAVSVFASYAAPVPFAETTVLAGWLLADAGIEIPHGPLTVAARSTSSVEIARNGSVAVLRGRARRVPWARVATAIATLARCDDKTVLALVPSAACRIERHVNMADEPRDDVHFDDVAISGLPSAELPTADALELRGALSRSIQIAGALARVLELCVEYAKVRQQFGRPIGDFQAVQQQLALLAGEADAASAAVGAAVMSAHASRRRSSSECDASREIAAAKVRTAAAATEGSRIAHQIHGAIGVTYEHALHHYTARLWAWRDEFGTERSWAIRLGRELAGMSGGDYWGWLTRDVGGEA